MDSSLEPSQTAKDPIDEILSRSYVVTSADGAVQVKVDAQGRVLAADVRPVASGQDVSASATESVRRSQKLACDETAKALAEAPGIDPQLRALLLGEF